MKIQNNMLVTNLLYIIVSIILMTNVIIRIIPQRFIKVSKAISEAPISNKVPSELYMYCDVYLLILFIILIFFTLGIDFNNSMEDIALAVGGSKTNKLMVRKLISILTVYLCLYIISFLNIYFLYKKLLPSNTILLPVQEVLLYSFVTNMFIISLSLFILFVSKDIAISTSLITAYYLIEEALWRCKITQTNGILGHIYQYYDYGKGGLLKVKMIYMGISIILLLLTYKISQRKTNYSIFSRLRRLS
ncbi:hypothetical protein [Clostridium yunnanense]|uniref:hypothetical protein n=1 Tax=Clostridium yunnanense TaxID=2800325 RepID=UPI001A9C4D5A|nr:hypothetical protein [Clostridium yunnanense]